jgi:hypothetical protein
MADITLHFDGFMYRSWSLLHPFFIVLQINTSLKKVRVNSLFLFDEPAWEALRQVLVKNKVLEELSLGLFVFNDTELASWIQTLQYLRCNNTLKTITLDVIGAGEKAYTFHILFYTVSNLRDTTSLESLDIKSPYIIDRDFFLVIIKAFGKNTSLKTLRIPLDSSSISDNWMKDLISVVKTNYNLECIYYYQTFWTESLTSSLISAHDKTGELDTIFKLNQAGRRYLIQEGPESIVKGVEVLVAVRDDHMLEKPTLCDIEHRNTMIGTWDDSRPTYPVADWTNVGSRV